MPSIDYREIEPLIEAFESYGKPNWSLWTGKTLKVAYDSGDLTEGANELQKHLYQIKNSRTGAVYTLKVYPENVTNVRNDSGYAGSMNFMLNSDMPVMTNQMGAVVIDRQTAQQSNSPLYPLVKEINEKVTNLERSNEELRNQLMQAKLDAMQEKFQAQIAGIAQQNNTPDTKEQIFGLAKEAIEKPDFLNAIFSGLERIIDKFVSKKDTPPAHYQPAINGTNNSQNMSETTTSHYDEEVEPLTQQELEAGLTMEDKRAMMSIYNSIDVLASKIGYGKVADALHTISQMNEMKLKGFLLML